MGRSLAVQKPGSLLFVTVFVIILLINYIHLYHVDELSERVFFFFHDVMLHAHKTCRPGQKREKNITINTWKRCEHKIINRNSSK